MKFQSPLRSEERAQSSAFLDVLFILMIAFFLVTSLSDDVQPDPQHAMVEVHLPELEHHEGRSEGGADSEEMELELAASGTIEFNGRSLGSGKTARDRLEVLVRERLARKSDPYVRVYADSNSRMGDTLPVIAMLRELGIAKLDLMGRDGKPLDGSGGEGENP